MPLRKLSPMKIPPSPLRIFPPVIAPPVKITPEKIAPYENYPPWNPLPSYNSCKWKKKQNYKIFCIEESFATQHPYQNNQSPLCYTDDLTENTGLRYFLCRMKKIQNSNESENRQMALLAIYYLLILHPCENVFDTMLLLSVELEYKAKAT